MNTLESNTRLCEDPYIDHIAIVLLSQLWTITLSYIYCIQHQHLKSASSFKPSVVVPPELNESLSLRNSHDPISAITQHHTSSRHLIDLTLLDCDGGILMKQALDHYVPIDCMHFKYAVKLQWRYTGSSLRPIHNFQIRILSRHDVRVKPDAVPKDNQHSRPCSPSQTSVSDMFVSTQ